MDKYLISVIVPIYNVEKYIYKCLDSIINQTYTNLEIILIDDGSPDNCGKICDEYAQKDIRIKTIHNKNSGVSSARNDGIKNASGKFITFVDSDDWLDLDYFQNMYDKANLIDADIIISNGMYTEFINESSKSPYFSKFGIYEKSNIEELQIRIFSNYNPKEKIFYHGSIGGPVSKFYSADLLKKNNIFFSNLCFAEDLLFNFIAFNSANSILNVNVCGYHYRQRKNSSVHRNFHADDLDTAISFMKNVYLYIDYKKQSDILHAINSRAIILSMLLLNFMVNDNKMSYSDKGQIISELKANKYFRQAIFDSSDEYLNSKQMITKKALQLKSNIPLLALYKLNDIIKKNKRSHKLYD